MENCAVPSSKVLPFREYNLGVSWRLKFLVETLKATYTNLLSQLEFYSKILGKLTASHQKLLLLAWRASSSLLFFHMQSPVHSKTHIPGHLSNKSVPLARKGIRIHTLCSSTHASTNVNAHGSALPYPTALVYNVIILKLFTVQSLIKYTICGSSWVFQSAHSMMLIQMTNLLSVCPFPLVNIRFCYHSLLLRFTINRLLQHL